MFHLTIEINRPLGIVWDYFIEPTNWGKWYGCDLKEVLPCWDQEAMLIWANGDKSTVTDYEPRKEIKISGTLADMIYRFEESNHSKTVIELIESAPKGGAYYTDGGAAHASDLKGQLEKLKSCIESETFEAGVSQGDDLGEKDLTEEDHPPLDKYDSISLIITLILAFIPVYLFWVNISWGTFIKVVSAIVVYGVGLVVLFFIFIIIKEYLKDIIEAIRFMGGFFLIFVGGFLFVGELDFIDVGAASEGALLLSTLFIMIGLLLFGYYFGGLAISLVFVIGYIDSSTFYPIPLLISIVTLLIFCASVMIKKNRQHKKLLMVIRKGNMWE